MKQFETRPPIGRRPDPGRLTERVIFDNPPVEEAQTRRNVETGEIKVAVSDSSQRSVLGGRRIALTLAFTLPSRQQLVNLLPFACVMLLAALLRFFQLGDKPLHHDESLHAYFSMLLMHSTLEHWRGCFSPASTPNCYHYDPLLHGPFQFHIMALVYKVSQWLRAPEHGINTTTVRIAAATLGTALVGLPYFLRDYLGKLGAWLACLLLAVSPCMVYYSRFAREDIYMACFTLLLVVAIARYMRDRSLRWFIVGALAFSLSYATKEATFLTAAVFGGFCTALCVWECGVLLPLRDSFSPQRSWLPRTWAPAFLLIFALISSVVALIFFAWLHRLSFSITSNQAAADAYVQSLKQRTQVVFPYLCIVLGGLFLVLLTRTLSLKEHPVRRRSLAGYVDPQKQRLLDTIVTMPWIHWFGGILAFMGVFLLLYTALFTDMGNGVGAGVWQGLYYWLQQIPVARGGQPWYYYLLLLPLYEQLGLVFGLAGLVICLLHPSRFRLFLVCWFVGNLALYSWGAEKMPWLTIHIMIPLLLLSVIALQPLLLMCVNLIGELRWRLRYRRLAKSSHYPTPAPRIAILGLVIAVLLATLTLHNMYEVTYAHAADAPHEMLVYTQTTSDVDTVLAKIKQLDDRYGSQKRISIGATDDTLWPFSWYLRDYSNVSWGATNCAPIAPRQYPYSVILLGGDCLAKMRDQYAGPNGQYLFHQYHLRSWWDEGYKPPPCVPNITNKNCEGQQTWGGVGPWLWLSYGDSPPKDASFNPLLPIMRVWNWWWFRQPLGATDGTYDMGLFINKNLGVSP